MTQKRNAVLGCRRDNGHRFFNFALIVPLGLNQLTKVCRIVIAVFDTLVIQQMFLHLFISGPQALKSLRELLHSIKSLSKMSESYSLAAAAG